MPVGAPPEAAPGRNQWSLGQGATQLVSKTMQLREQSPILAHFELLCRDHPEPAEDAKRYAVAGIFQPSTFEVEYSLIRSARGTSGLTVSDKTEFS